MELLGERLGFLFLKWIVWIAVTTYAMLANVVISYGIENNHYIRNKIIIVWETFSIK